MLTQGINHYPADLSVNKYPVPFTRWRFVQQIALSTLPTTKFWAMMGAYIYLDTAISTISTYGCLTKSC